MPVIGFGFTKISMERKKSNVKGEIKVNNNFSIKDIEQTDLALGKSKEKGLRFHFEFTSKYEPAVADLVMGGELLYLGDAKLQADILKEWKKSKKLLKEVTPEIVSAIVNRCNTESVVLSREINLPPPVPMITPQLMEQAGKGKGYIG